MKSPFGGLNGDFPKNRVTYIVGSEKGIKTFKIVKYSCKKTCFPLNIESNIARF
jgi:hypothetical protein